MTRKLSAEPNWRYLVCTRALSGAGFAEISVRYPELELALLRDVERVIGGCPHSAGSAEARRARLAAIARKLRLLRRKQGEIAATFKALRQRRAGPITRLEVIEREISGLEAERKELRARRPKWHNPALDMRLSELKNAATADTLDYGRVNAALRALLSSIRIDYDTHVLEFRWRHGGVSSLPYDPIALMKRQPPLSGRRRHRQDRHLALCTAADRENEPTSEV